MISVPVPVVFGRVLDQFTRNSRAKGKMVIPVPEIRYFMSPPSSRPLWQSVALGLFILAILALAPVALFGSASPAGPVPGVLTVSGATGSSPFIPVFTDPAVKLAETSDPAFTVQLLEEAVTYEPLLNTTGTQVHMGFWSGRGNHGSLVVLLDAINDLPAGTGTPQKAIWDEGATSSNQYPSYVTMQNEHWYERAMPVNGTVVIMGRYYTDPYPVTFAQADAIWGQYSGRYADMAEPIFLATGKPVKVWCFVEGARANRIFYTYEYPELRMLEQEGAVQVYFARTKSANWTDPGDWIEGTANAPALAA